MLPGMIIPAITDPSRILSAVTDPSASVGGDLGWVTRGRQVEGFDEVAFALAPGETSEIFETSFGFTIVRVDEKRDEQGEPFEQVRGQMTDPATAEAAAKVLDELVERFKNSVKMS